MQVISSDAVNASSVFAIDLNGDGLPDVLSASEGDNKLAWYENLGFGNFGPQLIISLEVGFNCIVFAIDFDADGDADVLSGADGKIAWYENDGLGNFSPEQIINTLVFGNIDIYAVDLDQDGDPDVLSSSSSSGVIAWYENDGLGNFGPFQIVVNNLEEPFSVFAEDLDGDADMDVISGSGIYSDLNFVGWYENDGDGNFGTSQIINSDVNAPSSVHAIDLDGDQDNDVVWTSGASLNKIGYNINNGDGTFGPQVIISQSFVNSRSLVAKDLDKDGDPDLLLTSFSDDNIFWFENDGAANFGPPQIIDDAINGAISVFAIDLDADGDEDVLGCSLINNEVFWYENLGFLVDAFPNNPSCIGLDNASIQVIVNSFTIPQYSYEWTLDGGVASGSGTSNEDQFVIEDLAAGTYDLIVVNALQDTAIINGIDLGALPGTFFEILEINTVNASNGEPNGSISILTNLGQADFAITWTGTSSGSQTISDDLFELNNIFAGNYFFEITDANGNVIEQEITILDETVPQETCNTPLDIVILNDVSLSVDNVEYIESKFFFIDLINALNIGFGDDESWAAIVEWAGYNEQEVMVPLTGNLPQLQNYINVSSGLSGGTNPNDALTFGYDYLEEFGRPFATKILILSTDGNEDQISPSLIALAEIYKAQGYVISTIAFDGAFGNPSSLEILQQTASYDFLVPGAPAYSQLTQDLANQIVNLYICTSDPGSSNTVFFNLDGSIEILDYTLDGNCPFPDFVEITVNVTAEQQLSVPAGTPITFYYNNPELFGATPILTTFIPCAIQAGSSEQYTFTLPISGPANVWAVLNDDGSGSPPISFPITEIEESIYINNIDQIEVCTDLLATLSVLKSTSTPIPVCDNLVYYTVDICNISSVDAFDVLVSDEAALGFDLLNINTNDNGCATISGPEGPFDIPVACCVTLTYEYDASNAASDEYFDQDVILSGPSNQEYINFEGASGNSEDVTIGEGIDCPSDIVLFEKSVTNNVICEDAFLTFTFNIINESNLNIQGVQFIDVLPLPAIWAAEPYLVEGLSIGSSNITGSNIADFIIDEIPAGANAIFYMDAYIPSWEGNVDLINTATLSNLPSFTNGTGADISSTSDPVDIVSLPEIDTQTEISICVGATEVMLSATIVDGDIDQWISVGDGQFSDPNSLNTIYTLGAEDLEADSIYLSIVANSSAGCGETSSNIVLIKNENFSNYESTEELISCNGAAVVFDGQSLASGSSTEIFYTSVYGCDSIITVNVLAGTVSLDTIVINACSGESAMFDGQSLIAGSNQEFVYQSSLGSQGCDSIVFVIVEELFPSLDSIELSTCDGFPIEYNGATLFGGMSMDFAYTKANGCDSIINVSVVSIDGFTDTLLLETCSGTTISFDGQNLEPNTSTDFSYVSSNGCDSIVNVSVVSIDGFMDTLLFETCSGTTIPFDGQNLEANTSTDFSYVSANGCDSTITVLVSEIVAVVNEINLSACENASIFYEGQELFPGQEVDIMLVSSLGCDSILQVEVEEILISEEDQSFVVCGNEMINFEGNLFGAGTDTTFIYTAQTGCDSLVNVLVNGSTEYLDSIVLNACVGESVLFDGESLMAGSSQEFVYQSSLGSQGCDSVVFVMVEEQVSFYENIEISTCAGVPVEFDGISLSDGMSMEFSYLSEFGCDSIVNVNVIEADSIEVTVSFQTCAGTSILFEGVDLAPNTSTEFSFNSTTGCDSIVTVVVSEILATINNINLSACENTSIFFQGQELFPGDEVEITLTSSLGCDSLLQIFVEEVVQFEEDQNYVVCDGEMIAIEGNLYGAGTNATLSYVSSLGCDSLINIIVEGSESYYEDLEISACDGAPAIYQGQSIAAGTSESFVYQTSTGCDSTIVVSVVDNLGTIEELFFQACEGSAIEFNQQSLLPNTTTIFEYQNALGCDSTIVVNVEETLVLNEELILNVCDGTSVEYDGQFLLGNSTTDFTYTSSGGCDSIMTVIVEEAIAYEEAIVLDACQGSFATYDGTEIMAGTEMIFEFQTVEGCDSLIYVSVSELPIYFDTLSIEICDNETQEINGITFESGMQETVLLSNVYGCDSSVMVEVIDLPSYEIDQIIDPCEASDVLMEGSSLQIGSQLTLTMVSSLGCDSLINYKVENKEENLFMLPNAFSPNGDGINDQICLLLDPAVNQVELSIYNRWGEQVFYTRDLNACWDGTYKGVEQDVQTFVWSASLEATVCDQAVMKFHKGSFTLVR